MRCGVLVLLIGASCSSESAVVIGDSAYSVAGIACTAEERRIGLSDTASFEVGQAFIIDFPVEDEVCIQNASTPFDLDLVYVVDGSAVRVERGVPAGDGTPRCHRAEVVVELVAGSAARAGDAVVFSNARCR